MNNRPQVLMSDAFCNVIRTAEGNPEILRAWIEEMEGRIAILQQFDDILLGVFTDQSVVCLPKSKEVTHWYSGEFDQFANYLAAFPEVGDVIVPRLVEIFYAVGEM